MGKLDAEINGLKSMLNEKVKTIDGVYTRFIESLFDKGLRREAMEAEDGRKRMKGVYEQVLRHNFKTRGHIIVLRVIIVEVDWVAAQFEILQTLLKNFDGTETLLNTLKDLGFSIDIIKDSVYCDGKNDLLRLFKVKNLDTMNSFYSVIKWDRLELGLPEDLAKDSKALDGTPVDLRKKRGDKKKMKIFATTKDDVAIAAMDFFSIGHILMGQCFFFLFYALVAPEPPNIFTAPLLGSFNWLGLSYSLWCAIFAVIIGIIWEPFENIILWKLGMKFESKRDSWLNSLFDIIFVSLGAFIAFTYNGFWLHLGLIIGESIVFFILRWYFLNK